VECANARGHRSQKLVGPVVPKEGEAFGAMRVGRRSEERDPRVAVAERRDIGAEERGRSAERCADRAMDHRPAARLIPVLDDDGDEHDAERPPALARGRDALADLIVGALHLGVVCVDVLAREAEQLGVVGAFEAVPARTVDRSHIVLLVGYAALVRFEGLSASRHSGQPSSRRRAERPDA